ncbi:MAG TPA: MoaD/ThiS family protein, partial [Pyrinomonadaceae bacterium]|nr:MoaD/ThiS family protein [Pyrinomonadaceae bacterium]
ATADVVGQRSLEKSLPDGETSKTVFDRIKDEFPKLSGYKLHYALNQNYATGKEIVHDGDELAIFTAVSGG